MSICPSCQAENLASYQFCQFCGTKIAVNLPIAISDNESTSESTSESTDEETQPLNLEGLIGEINTHLETFEPSRPSQVVTREEELPEELPEELLEELPTETNLEVIPDANLELSVSLTSPSYLQNITYAGKTDVGKQRDRNEDDFAAIFQTRSINGKSQISDHSYRGLFVLCDGMGGHEGGAEASAIAVNSIIEQFQPFWIDTLPGSQKLEEIIRNANQAIFTKNESEQRQSLGRMGTTLVMLTIYDLEVAIAHVGDSRIYKVTNSPNLPAEDTTKANLPKLEQITRDHEVLNQLIDLGVDLETAQARPDAHQLTQALGPNPTNLLSPSIQIFSLTEPTLFLLCSDGLCDNDAIEQNWRSHLLPILNKEIDLQTGLNNLIELGNNINGYDNLTAILVLCDLNDQDLIVAKKD